MERRLMTKKELFDWQNSFQHELLPEKRASVDDVHFFLNSINSVCFSYKKAEGLFFADNGFIGYKPDGKNYYPLVKIRPTSFGNGSVTYDRYCEPNLKSMAKLIKEMWSDFIQ